MANKFESEIAQSFKQITSDLPAPLTGPYEYIRLFVTQLKRASIESIASTHKQPCDALVDIYQDSGLALELKESATRGSFPFGRVPEHQVEGLIKFHLLGRKSFLLVCYRKWSLTTSQKSKMTPKEIRETEKRRAYAIPIYDFVEQRKQSLENGKKSLSIDYIEKEGVVLSPLTLFVPTEKGLQRRLYVWDILPLVQYKYRKEMFNEH